MGRGTRDASNDEPGRGEQPAAMRDESMTSAATRIQAGFRGYKVRKQMKQGRRELEERSATTIQAGVRGFLARKRRQQEQQAATTIQAGFRGLKARRAATANTK